MEELEALLMKFGIIDEEAESMVGKPKSA